MSTTPTPTGGAGAADTAGSGRSSNVGAIVGGVVGGILGVLMLGAAVLFSLLRRRRKAQQPAHAQAGIPERPISTATATATATDYEPETGGGGHQPSLKPMSMISTPSVIYVRVNPIFPSFRPFGAACMCCMWGPR